MRPFLLALLLCAACTPAVSGGMGSRAVSVVSNATPTIDALAYAQYEATAQQSARDVVSTQDAQATAEQYSASRVQHIERVERAIETRAALTNTLLSISISATMTAAPIVYSQTIAGATATALAISESRAHTFEMNTQAEDSARRWGWVFIIAFVVSVIAALYTAHSFVMSIRNAQAQKIMDEGQGELELLRARAQVKLAQAELMLRGATPLLPPPDEDEGEQDDEALRKSIIDFLHAAIDANGGRDSAYITSARIMRSKDSRTRPTAWADTMKDMSRMGFVDKEGIADNSPWRVRNGTMATLANALSSGRYATAPADPPTVYSP